MFWKDGDNVVRVRSLQDWTPDAGYDLVLAAPAHDIWSLGCVLFLLCTGITLVCRNVNDDLMYEEDFIKLWEWTEATKRTKLSQVKNHLSRNLLSLLLMKYPRSRLDASQVLSHPFLTGVSGSRLPGSEPKWDVFLSYRVDSDSDLSRNFTMRLRRRDLWSGGIRSVCFRVKTGRLGFVAVLCLRDAWSVCSLGMRLSARQGTGII